MSRLKPVIYFGLSPESIPLSAGSKKSIIKYRPLRDSSAIQARISVHVWRITKNLLQK
jgi:hypothetical protein